MKKKFQILFVLIACLHLLGGPYALIQICAWGTMLASYSQESGILQGARETFSGERPCKLCCNIAAAKVSDFKSETPQLPEKIRSLKLLQEMLAGEILLLAMPEGMLIPDPGFCDISTWREDFIPLPPTPPPRREA
ncbi:MAG: hypothetical protein H7Y36_08140 [Armatimonadetes bacterium]|nr:hypothetical protein [Akkermansiaceae bacterium]